MVDIDALLNELVIANHILANENVVDSFGHISVRHPENPDHIFYFLFPGTGNRLA